MKRVCNYIRARSYAVWIACCTGMIILSVLTFTPLVIPAGVITPLLFGIPYTLWTGMLIAILMLLLTIVASLVHPHKNDISDNE